MTAVLDISGLVRHYHALRPLRVARLSLAPGEHLALLGFDQPSAEVFVNLATGAVLPDEGEVRVFGQSTASISDSEQWLSLVDRFGIVSERAVLMEPMTVVQNLAIPFSLDIEPPPPELRQRALALAKEVAIADQDCDRRLGDLDATARLRVRLARALALDPAIVLLEHPSAALDPGQSAALGREIRGVLDRRGRPGPAAIASLTLTADPEFAAGIASIVLILDPATGALNPRKRGWFGPGKRSL